MKENGRYRKLSRTPREKRDVEKMIQKLKILNFFIILYFFKKKTNRKRERTSKNSGKKQFPFSFAEAKENYDENEKRSTNIDSNPPHDFINLSEREGEKKKEGVIKDFLLKLIYFFNRKFLDFGTISNLT